ncbi:YbgA family protein [Streptococcus hyovaginalis]|uniref:YbgA family protein n=1 Tax=Streptococcus hyovaginalis TaxID=149015 RepID=UPI0004089B41|nr:YbgA family protein [Streptococcus hyovaginalis]MDY3024149.1 YbgA family protein [Streptococcus hyovaginalis]MDY4511499.1 YbgA family protein [Streptococcus hyovaginalis]MDY5973437.1 YbgA family protein [Streptococcus hyovaginalis]
MTSDVDVKGQLLKAQKEWAYQKYWVMAHSQQHYNALRQLFKGNEWSSDKAETFQHLLAEAEQIEPTLQTLRTAYQHVWGYFKKIASSEERECYKHFDATLDNSHREMLVFLQSLTAKYHIPYLMQSRLLCEGL